jgi:hypothetical protein
MKSALMLILVSLLSAHFVFAGDPYDFRQSDAYRKLSKEDRDKLDQVQRDFMTLWGALDLYADLHDNEPPDSLDQLVPNYLKGLPSDPFATAETASLKEKNRTKSKNGWGFQYEKGSKGNRAWSLISVGLPKFPFLAAEGNYGLYVCKGYWISGKNPTELKMGNGKEFKYVVGNPLETKEKKEKGKRSDAVKP